MIFLSSWVCPHNMEYLRVYLLVGSQLLSTPLMMLSISIWENPTLRRSSGLLIKWGLGLSWSASSCVSAYIRPPLDHTNLNAFLSSRFLSWNRIRDFMGVTSSYIAFFQVEGSLSICYNVFNIYESFERVGQREYVASWVVRN